MTHQECLKHLRAELEKQGALVVRVQFHKRLRAYMATSCVFVHGGHCFYWKVGSTNVTVTNVNSTGKEVVTGSLTISAD